MLLSHETQNIVFGIRKAYADTTVLEYIGKGEAADTAYYEKNRDSGIRKYYIIDARYLFWSEGIYLYCLKVPQVYPTVNDAAFEEIVTSLTAVADISEYLPEVK